MIPIFIAGPHGSGKTTLIDELVKKDTQFEKDDFQIDFLKEFQSMPTMTIFEKCIVRLYHRFYTAELANYKCRNNNTLSEKKFLIIDRSLYDSLVYIQVEKELGELSDGHYKLLLDICQKCIEIINPKTIILNPDISLILNRLNSRREKGKRKLRDELCFREDNINYVGKMHRLFENYYSNENILHIKDNDENSINLIYNWLNKF